ncbi:MAG: DUF2726 domain-containing protein [Anaerolineae bacterium]
MNGTPILIAVGIFLAVALFYAIWPELEAALSARRRVRTKETVTYQVRDDLLSGAERSFLLILTQAVAEWAIVFPHVSLRDLLSPARSDSLRRWRADYRLGRERVDFLLCDVRSLRPLLGVELEDAQQSSRARLRRNALVASALASAGLPLVRIPVQYTYDRRELNVTLMRQAGLLGGNRPSELVPAAPPAAPAPPTCTKCGKAMVLRTVTSGPSLGQQFWGCSDYPRCDGVLPYQEVSEDALHTPEQSLSFHTDPSARPQ